MLNSHIEKLKEDKQEISVLNARIEQVDEEKQKYIVALENHKLSLQGDRGGKSKRGQVVAATTAQYQEPTTTSSNCDLAVPSKQLASRNALEYIMSNSDDISDTFEEPEVPQNPDPALYMRHWQSMMQRHSFPKLTKPNKTRTKPFAFKVKWRDSRPSRIMFGSLHHSCCWTEWQGPS